MSDQNKNNKNKLTDTENTNSNEQELSLEEQQKLMEKYDIESNTRKLTGILGWVVFIVLVAFSLFHLYTGIFGAYTAYIQRTIHLGFALSLIFMLFPAKRGMKKTSVAWYDWI